MNNRNRHLNLLFNWGIYLLVIILCLLLLVSVKTSSEIISPTFIFVKSLIFEDGRSLPLLSIFAIIVRFLLLFCAAYLIFIVFSTINIIFSYNSYRSLAAKYDQKIFSLWKTLKKGFNWNLYRVFYVLFPPMSVMIAGILLFLAFIYFFNVYLLFAGWSLGLVTFLTCFTFISLILGFIFSLGLSLYNLIITFFGIECAVSEPNLSNNTIKNRSARLSFNKSFNSILYLFYFLFIIAIVLQIILAIILKSSINIDNSRNIIIILMANLAFLFALSRIKTHLYIESLLKQYKMATIQDKNISF